jgi:hypothetical protein
MRKKENTRKPETPDRGRRPLMVTLAAAALVVLADLAVVFLYLPSGLRRGLPLHILAVCVLALVIFWVGRVISVAVLKDRGRTELPKAAGLSAGAKTVRFVLLAILAVFLELVVIQRLNPSGRNPMLFNLVFYLAFFVFGLLLARDQDAEFVPVLFGLIVAVVLAGAEFALFVSNPAMLSRFGAERLVVGVRGLVIRVDALPMDIAITWAAWRVSRANRIPPASAGRR